jgi:hypothetical protein
MPLFTIENEKLQLQKTANFKFEKEIQDCVQNSSQFHLKKAREIHHAAVKRSSL